ncbi:hypothetical protein [Elizabethkingia anophelis]|uniref:hypothetical protein n=1 Tax=Elizabethkingia anophelis TaxID=1117645 RepID=UPI003892C3B1
MKSISENFTKIIKGIALGSVVFIGVSSCSSRDDKSEDLNNSAKATLNFNIVGIENAGGVSASASVDKQGSTLGGSSVITKENTVSLKDFDVLTSMEKVGGLGTIASSAGMNGAQAATQPMTAGVKYLIQVYVAGTTTNPVVNTVATAGVDPSITVPAGQSYDWYVFSTNDGTAPVINNGVISSSTIANKDVLYAKSATPVSVQSGQNDLAVSFRRNTVRVDVNVDARGLFGKIGNTTTVELGTGTGGSFASIVKSGDLNIFTGAYTNIQAVPAVISGSSMVNTAGAQGDVGATKTASFYTVDASANAIPANLSVKLGTLGINMDDNTLRTFSGVSVAYTNTAITPVIGTQYLLNARMIESGIAQGTAIWARTNLQYAEYATDKYRFLPTNDIAINQLLNILDLVQLGFGGNTITNKITNLYWNFNASTPEGASGSGDPCALVYPTGKWRTPTSAEFTSLGTPAGAAGRYVDVGNGVISDALFAGQWPIPGTVDSAFPVHSQRLFIPMYGYRASTGNVLDTPSALLPGVAASVTSNYWTSNNSGANGVKFFRSLTTVLSVIGLDTGYSTPTEFGAGKGMSVRCVRS